MAQPAPLPRHVYNGLLRDAIAEVTPGLPVVTLERLEQLLERHFQYPLPGRPALARILQTIGWRKIAKPDGEKLFARPGTTRSIGTIN